MVSTVWHCLDRFDVPYDIEEDAWTETAILQQGFVDHIPSLAPSFVPVDDCGDVSPHHVDELLTLPVA